MHTFVKNQTSFYEQAIYYYISRFFSDATNRVLFAGDIEADIFIPSINCVIEYDGLFWHDKKIGRDNEKNKYFNSIGIKVIRVRDSGLSQLEPFDGLIFVHKTKSADVGYHIDEIIELIIHFLAEQVNDKKLQHELASFKLSHDIYLQDTPDINSVFYTTPIPDNLSSCHGIEFWDYEKNKRFKPENVPWKYRQNVFFKCKMGESKFAHHSCWLTRQGEPVQEYKNYCPFLFFCKDDCDVQHHYLYDCFYKEKNLVEQEDIINLRQFLSCSTFTKEYITTRLQADCSLKFVRIFDYIFIRHYTIGTITTCHFECVIKWASSVEDLELIKKLYIKYEPVYILIDAKNFDKTTAQREAFIDYFQWLFNRETEKEYYQNSARLFENCLLNIIADKTITKEFVAKSLSLIDNNIGLFRNDESFVNHLKSLMK